MAVASAAAPLLGDKKKKHQPSLTPLYVVTLLRAIAWCVAKLPALSLRFQDLAATAGVDPAEATAKYGQLVAARSILEFIATPLLAAWSDRVGRKLVLILTTVAFICECSILASTDSMLAFGLVHIMGGLFADSQGALESCCIADATEPGEKRSVCFGRLFATVGAAMVVGPALGGELVAWRSFAPFAAAAVLGSLALTYQVLCMPEYLPASRRNSGPQKKPPSVVSLPVGFLNLLRSQKSLVWYVAASALYNLGGTSYSSVQPLWVKEAFGWDGRAIGKYTSVVGLTLMLSQLTLPQLLGVFKGNELLVAQCCCLVNVMKMLSYSMAPSGGWVFVFLLISTPGMGAVSIMKSLCTKAAKDSQQGLLSGGMAALSTSVSVLGALIGSKLLATAQEQGHFLGTFMLFSAGSFVLATACLRRAVQVEGHGLLGDGDDAADVGDFKRQLTP
eukprot:TRINITY_DN20921_c0_g1_i3.p1 TRINITY_DN20921_c0_g1~~TRINITY_DN20921_c0_g1_i3.p1  ORF type:complete len:448 (-),score=101.00 TRINITY_DN20921_c0_g1_i3:418-1761(-)